MEAAAQSAPTAPPSDRSDREAHSSHHHTSCILRQVLRRTGGIEPRFLKENVLNSIGLKPRKELQNRFLTAAASSERVTQHQGGNSLGGDAASKCIRKSSASHWPQSVAQSFCRQFPSLQYVCRSCLSPSAFSVRPLPHRGQISESFLHHRCK